MGLTTLAVLLQLVAGDSIGPEAPTGLYVFTRENALCRDVNDASAPVALVVRDTGRAPLENAEVTVAGLHFRANGETRPDDVIKTLPVGKGRAFGPSGKMVAVVTAPGCASEKFVVDQGVKACLMVVLKCETVDAGVP